MSVRLEPAFFDRTQAVDNSGNYMTADIPYFIFDVADEDAAITFAKDNVPETCNEMPLESIEIDERINVNTFKISAQYKAENLELPQIDTSDNASYTFDTTGGTKHMTQSLDTMASYPGGVPNYEGAIGYDGENINGVDVTMPVMNFSETHYLSDKKVTTKYKKIIAELTGTMNNKSFKGYDAGEVLFLGASGSKRGDGYWEITYKFAVSVHKRNFEVGEISIPCKRGWDYMWVRYEDDVADDNLIKKPTAVYIEQVYEFEDFGYLGIGR